MTSHRRTLAAALATAAASVSLYPIFTGGLWFLAGLGAIAVVAAAGTATRLRRLPEPVCLLGGLVALLLYLNVAFANSRSLLHLLPTPASARLLAHLVSQGFAEAGKYAPPVPELAPMVLLAAAGIGIAALLTDWMAVRLGSAALAGLPLLLLFTEPFTLSVGRGFLGTTVAFCVGIGGYLALLSSEGKDRIREWESQDPSARDAPDTKALAAAGRRVGFASVVVALILPLVIPGVHVTRLFGGQAGIGGRGGAGVSGPGSAGVGFPGVNTQFSQELSSELDTPSQIVLGYTTAVQSPDYLQLYVLDKLTDTGWTLFSQPESTVRVSPRVPAPPGLDNASLDGTVTTTVSVARDVGSDDLDALPVPYPTTTIKAKGNLEADRSTLMVFDQGTPLGGLSYQVTSLINSPSEQALDTAPAPPAVIRDNYLEVPASYDSLRALAESVVAKDDANTPFEKAVALQNWLSDGSFKYTLKAPTVLSASGLSQFLNVTKRGYCQQFSFAMATLARLLGIPSRVAYGFTSGSPVGDDEWQVTTHDAHAWPELYFTGYGWLRFEPTPSGPTGQGTAYAPAYTDLSGGSATGAPSQSAPNAAPSSPTGSSASRAALRHHLSEQLGDQGGANLGGVGSTLTAAKASGTNPWEVFGLVLAGLLILGLVAPWAARLVIRRRRWHLSRRLDGPDRADAEWAHAAWRELRDDLTDYGADCLPSDTPRAVAARAGTQLALAEPALEALGRIAMAEERARYAARPTDGSGLRHDSVTVRRAIAVAVPRPTRWRGRLLPASVIGPALNATAQAADIFGRLTPEWLSRFRTPAP
jgi:transglutaminase-like putative cysteine protease